MKTITTFLLIALSFSVAFAQNTASVKSEIQLTLKVKNTDGKLVTNKRVRLVNLENNTTQSGITNNEGVLELKGNTNAKYHVFYGKGNVPLEFYIPETPYKKVSIPLVYDPNTSEKIQPSKDEIILRLSLNDYHGNGVKDHIILEDKKENLKYELETDLNGNAELLVKKSNALLLHLDYAKNFSLIRLPDKGQIIFNQEIKLADASKEWKIYPVYNKGLINFHFYDLGNEPIKGETFYAVNLSTKEKYEVTTNKFGLGQILVPLNAKYSLSHFRNKDFRTCTFKKNNNGDVFVLEVDFVSISEKERELRKEERLALLKMRDSLMKVSPATFDYSRFTTNSTQISFIEGKAKYYSKLLKKDPNVFVKEKKQILAVFNRFSAKWKNKIIVTDVTGSMSPYMTEVMVWHALKKIENEANHYVFFNDGDSKLTHEKKIGSTGGIYNIKSNKLDVVYEKLIDASSNGYGGDGPENDLEALLKAQELRNKISEVILVADNFSDARDISLLSELKVPVRVIACGGALSQTLNEQYLNIAMKTKGSIHTLQDDIMDLYKKNEGEKVKIQGKNYVLRNGEFLLLKY